MDEKPERLNRNGEWGMGSRLKFLCTKILGAIGEWGMGNGIWLIIFLVLCFKNSSNQKPN
jgi:hypothetical protein